MGATVKGNQIDGLVRQSGDMVNQLDDGTWEAEVKYICRWTQVMILAPRRNIARHPDFPTMLCKGCKVRRLKPGFIAQVDVIYRGFGAEGPPLGTAQTSEEIITSVSDADIETHPDFVTVIGGTAEAPLNGAIFNEDKAFIGWKSGSPYAGTRSYLIGSTTYRKTYPVSGRPTSVGPVGRIRDPGISGPPTTNWLYTGKIWRRDGGVYVVTEEWMMSGPGGFNPTIYPG